MHDREWMDIIKEVRGDIPQLVEDFMKAFAEVGTYGESAVSDSELRLTAFDVLSLIMDVLAGAMDEEEFHNHASALGRRRAQQNVPIASLVDAVQLDFLVIWSRLRAAAGGNERALIEHVDQLHNIVAKYNFFVRDSFRREQARSAQDLRLANARYLERLYASETLGTLGVSEAAQVLGLRADSPCTALIFHPTASIEARQLLSPETSSGAAFGHGFRGMYAIFWPGPAAVSPEVAALPGVRFDNLAGLAAVREAVRCAPTIFDATGTPTALADAATLTWAVAGDALAQFPSAGMNELTATLTELRAKGDPILDTLESYLETGSIKQAAEASFCHRNTVINRLNQFAALSGLDATRPVDAAKIILALRRAPLPPVSTER